MGRRAGLNQASSIRAYFLYFVLYSVIGWCYEVLLEVAIYRTGFTNRGVLFGPYCVVYGFGALILIATLRALQKKDIRLGRVKITPALVFVGIVVITTVVELIASYLMEWTLGQWQWDYTRFAWDFQGRIAPNPSLRFGIGGMVFLYLLQPRLERLAGSLSSRVLTALTAVLAVAMAADVIFTFLL